MERYKPKPDIGPLRRVLKANNVRLSKQTVLSVQRDPYRLDTRAGHRDAAWFMKQFEIALARSGLSIIHIRGVHYAIVSAPRPVRKPNGKPYRNTNADWNWLSGTAAMRARWLQYVPFSSITDERSEDPQFFSRDEFLSEFEPMGSIDQGGVAFDPIDLKFSEPDTSLVGFHGRQPFHNVIYTEKASVSEAIIAAAERYDADVYLGPGTPTDTRIYEIAASNKADGRPLRLFTLCDFDPSGWHMTVIIARKLQALRDLEFPDLDFEVHRIGLVESQVRELGLPSSFLKEKENRADKWREAHGGLEQTEIDALVLQPDVLRQMLDDALSPFHDSTLRRRVDKTRATWTRKARALLDDELDSDAVAALRERSEEALSTFSGEIESINDELADLVPKIELPKVPAVPLPKLDPDLQGKPLCSSEWSWTEQTEALIRDKNYEGEK